GEEDGRNLIRNGIGIKAGMKRRIDAANDGPVIKAFAEGQHRHDPQKQGEPPRPLLPLLLAFVGMYGLEGAALAGSIVTTGIQHGSSISCTSGAKYCSTSAAEIASSVDGCQRGAWSLSMITARTPS